MCEIGDGVIVLRPAPNTPGYGFAAEILELVGARYGARMATDLVSELRRDLPAVWSPPNAKAPERHHERVPRKFIVERYEVTPGTEMLFAEDLRQTYYEEIFSHPWLFDELATGVRLAAAPNWQYFPGAVADVVPDPFSIGANHSTYLAYLGIANPSPHTGAGVKIAVLDNGFDSQFWQSAPSPLLVGSGDDLISGDTSTKGHGTLMAALIASAAPGATIEPIRMAGADSTEWDALHAIARAVQFDADVVTLAYRQILLDMPCAQCGLVRRAARSEVFAKLLEWACEGDQRAFLAAAGNDGIQTVAPPSAYNGAIPVAALDQQCVGLAAFSNWDGQGRLSVLAAPGEDVATSFSSGKSYHGTSFATAYAAGAFAIAKERNPSANVTTIKQLVSSAITVSNASCIAVPP